MLTIYPVSAGSGIDYLLSTVASGDRTLGVTANAENWATGADTPGRWVGRGAAALGLSGEVTQEHADALFKYGENPLTGEVLGRKWRQFKTVEQRYEERLHQEPRASAARKAELRALVEREGERSARAGWEMVVSPKKSFMIMLEVAEEADREKLLAIEERAFRKLWARIEADAGYARVGANGVAQVPTQGLTAAVFVHRSSRAGDPAFHRHISISTKVFADGKWLALDARPLHRQRVTFGEIYDAELERGMAEELGITATEREGSLSFDKRPVREYRGVSKKLLTEFSSRRRQTEKHLRVLRRDFTSREEREPTRAEAYRLAQMAALTARPDKELRNVADERRQWRRRARAAGLAQPERIVELAQRASAQAARHAPQTPEEHALASRRTTALSDIPRAVVTVLEQQRETWTRPNAEAEVIRQLVTCGHHISLGDRFDEVVQQLTTAVLSPEHCELVDMPELIPVPSAYIRKDGTSLFHDAGCTRYTSHTIKAAERAVVEAAKSTAPVRTLSHVEIIAALEAGHDRRGFIPSDEQQAIVHGVFTGERRVQAIIGRAGAGKTTIMALLREVGDFYGIPVIGLANGQVQADVLGDEASIRTENIRRWLWMSEGDSPSAEWTLPQGAIVIIDEAGQAASTDMAALLKQTAAVGGRLLPVGDPLQLGAPGPGGLLAQIEAEAGALYLTEVRRFRDYKGRLRTWEIEASKALAQGDATASFEAYHARGRIHAGSADSMATAAYEAWLADTEDGLVSILIAPDNALASSLSARARDERIDAGLVDNKRTVALRDGNRAGAGDRVVTRAIDRKIKVHGGRGYVRNGDLWNVTKVRRDGSLEVRATQSKARAVLPASYVEQAVELGYAITKDRAQGLTTDTAHAVVTQGMNRNALYPSATRGKYANHMYLVITPEVKPIVGEPDPVRTARQVWARIVGRDGTTRSASVAQRESLDAAESLHTLVPRLRFVLDDLAAQRVATVLGDQVPMAEAIVRSDAWPALCDLLTRIEVGGADPVAAVQRVIPIRDFADADDIAAVVHWRLHQDDEVLAALDAAEARALEEPRMPRLLAQLNLLLPETDGSDKGAYAHALAQAITTRAEELATAAVQGAVLGEGWAAAYGSPPDDPVAAKEWRDRLASAAAYRDLAQWTGDALGPAPAAGPGQQGLRRIWRDGQPPVEEAVATARVLAAAEAGARWLDGLGPVPDLNDPRRTTWMNAATAIDIYRERWGFGREDITIGDRPTEPVQALDYDATRAAIDLYYQATPPRGGRTQADRDTLEEQVRRGQLGALRAGQAAHAEDAAHAARRAAQAAEQAAEDAKNRAAAVREAVSKAHASPTLATRADQLDALATIAAETARDAVQRAEDAEAQARHHGARALQARADAQTGRDAARTLDAMGEQPTPGPMPWRQRPFGALSDSALQTAQSSALARARLADTEADHALRRAERLAADAAPGGRIDTEVADRAQRIAAIIELRQTCVALAQAQQEQSAAESDLTDAQMRLRETGRFGRPLLRGAERHAAQEQSARAESRRDDAERRAAALRENITRLTAVAGPEADREQALREWERLGGSINAVAATERTVAAGDATRAQITGERMRRRAEEHRQRAGGLRREIAIRATMDPEDKRAEDAERARVAHEAQQQRAQEAAQQAARQQEVERNRREGNRY